MTSPRILHIPRSLTAPDAWVAVLLAAYLQYKQYTRLRKQKNNVGKIHAGAKSKPQRQAFFSIVHECLFTNLHMMVSPFNSQASDLGAEMVDLQSEQELNSYASKVASGGGKMPKQKKSKKGAAAGGGVSNDGKTMEVRSRRIMRGEMIYNHYYPALETTLNLALSLIVGLASRWMLGLIRSLTLSSATSGSSISGPGGPCCSPYRGGDDEGTRLPGSFERLLACVLIKLDGDNAGTFMLTILLLMLIVGIIKMSWSVSMFSASKNDDLNDLSDTQQERDTRKKTEGDEVTYKRVHPKKAKRFVVGVVATLSSLMLFHTPSLLRALGLAGLTEAAEEWGARVILFGNLLGVVSLPDTGANLEEPSETVQLLMYGLLVILAITWGYIAAGMMTPIEESARNAAYILSPSANKSKKPKQPNEMLDLMNVRMMLVIQALAPIIIMCTFLFNARFAETTKAPGRVENTNTTFSKQYLRNSGLYMRVVLSWCFVGASSYTIRPLLQSFLDQASSVASAMATLGEGIMKNDASVEQKSRSKSSQTPPSKPQRADPFNERYRTLVFTAGRIAAFPAFVLALLGVAHLRGGDGSAHPGVGYQSQPKDAPRPLMATRGLLPPYSEQLMSSLASQSKQQRTETGSSDALLHVAATSQSLWDATPVRDAAHKKVVNWIGGRQKYCYPPEQRSVKAVGRHVDYLLNNNGSDTDAGPILTVNPLTGRELLDMSPPIPVTLVDVLLGRTPITSEKSCKSDADDPNNSQGAGECQAVYTSSLTEFFSFLTSHNFMTPTIIFPIVDTIAFLCSIWWTYYYSLKMFLYWIRLRGAEFLQISA